MSEDKSPEPWTGYRTIEGLKTGDGRKSMIAKFLWRIKNRFSENPSVKFQDRKVGRITSLENTPEGVYMTMEITDPEMQRILEGQADRYSMVLDDDQFGIVPQPSKERGE